MRHRSSSHIKENLPSVQPFWREPDNDQGLIFPESEISQFKEVWAGGLTAAILDFADNYDGTYSVSTKTAGDLEDLILELKEFDLLETMPPGTLAI